LDEICACEQWKVKSGQDNEFISRLKEKDDD